jgi:hypothetical protein
MYGSAPGDANISYIVSAVVVAGFSNALWLLMFGVNEQRWREQAKAAGQ